MATSVLADLGLFLKSLGSVILPLFGLVTFIFGIGDTYGGPVPHE